MVANAEEPTIAFYALSTSQSVERDTWAFLMNLAEHKVTTELDQQAGVLHQTGWFDNTAVLDGWAEEDDDFKIRQRYQFVLKNDAAPRHHDVGPGAGARRDHRRRDQHGADAGRCPALRDPCPEPVLPLLRQAAQGPQSSTSPAMAWGWNWGWTTTS